jgi:hypothetical protein
VLRSLSILRSSPNAAQTRAPQVRVREEREVKLFMPKYPTNWVDYRLPTGQEFSVAVCGFSGKVRHLYIGQDPIRRLFIHHVIVEDGFCHTGDHCMALDCPFNRSEQEHLLHMLDMNEDEPLDPEVAEQWGSGSTLECFLRFARQIVDSLPEELKKPQAPLPEEE